MEKLISKNIVKGTKVILDWAGSKTQAKVINVKKDRTGAMLNTGPGRRPLWYPADSIIEIGDEAPKVPETVKATAKKSTSKKDVKVEAVDDLPKVPQGIIDAAAEAAGEAPANAAAEEKEAPLHPALTEKQAKVMRFLHDKKSMTLDDLKVAIIETGIQTVHIMKSLIDIRLASVAIDAGVNTYSITEAGEGYDPNHVVKAKTSRGDLKETVISMIEAGAKNKDIINATGCNSSYPWKIKVMLKITKLHFENPKLTNEEISKELKVSLRAVEILRPKV